LLIESQVRHFAIVFRDADVAGCRRPGRNPSAAAGKRRCRGLTEGIEKVCSRGRTAVLFQFTVKLVTVSKVVEYCSLNWEEWRFKPERLPTPVPERKGC